MAVQYSGGGGNKSGGGGSSYSNPYQQKYFNPPKGTNPFQNFASWLKNNSGAWQAPTNPSGAGWQTYYSPKPGQVAPQAQPPQGQMQTIPVGTWKPPAGQTNNLAGWANYYNPNIPRQQGWYSYLAPANAQSNAASTARYQGMADQYHQQQANAAAAARYTGLANEHYGSPWITNAVSRFERRQMEKFVRDSAIRSRMNSQVELDRAAWWREHGPQILQTGVDPRAVPSNTAPGGGGGGYGYGGWGGWGGGGGGASARSVAEFWAAMTQWDIS